MHPGPREVTPNLHSTPTVKRLRKGKLALKLRDLAPIGLTSQVTSLTISDEVTARALHPLLFDSPPQVQ